MIRNNKSPLQESLNWMKKLGCLNESFGDDMDEVYRDPGNRIDNRDDNARVEVTDSHMILYNASRATSIDSIIKCGMTSEYFGSSAGTAAWGYGIYTNYQRYQAHWRTVEDPRLYGNILVKMRYDGNIFQEFIIFEPKIAKQSVSSQIKKHHPELYKMLTNKGCDFRSLDAQSNGDFSSHGASYLRNYLGGGRRMGDTLLTYGVKGIIFYGHNDRPVVVVYDVDRIKVLEYADMRGKRLNDPIEWKKVSEEDGGQEERNDMRPIFYFLKKKYGYSPRFTRAHCGEIVVKNQETGKMTYIDVDKVEQKIKGGNVDERLFGDFEFEIANIFEKCPNGKEMALVQITKDKEMTFYIDKSGNLYKSPKDEQPYSDIDFIMYEKPKADAKKSDKDDDVKFNGSDDDFELFMEKYNGRIKQVVESMLKEDRQEVDIKGNRYVIVDNFDNVRKMMKFDYDDAVYYIKIVQRHADNPDRYYDHEACEHLPLSNPYVIHSVEELNEHESDIKTVCRLFGARAYIYMNTRPEKETTEYAKKLAPKFAHDTRKGREVEVAFGQSKDWNGRPICHLDVDTDDEAVHQKVWDVLKQKGIKPMSSYRSVTNGLHIIFPNKEEVRNIDWKNILDDGYDYGRWATAGLEIDKPIVLYSYTKQQKDENGNYNPHAKYDVQRRMQAKLKQQQQGGRRIREAEVNELDWKTKQNVANEFGRGEKQSIDNSNNAIDQFNDDHGFQSKTSDGNYAWVKRDAHNVRLLTIGFDSGLEGHFRYGAAWIGNNKEWELYSQSDHKTMTPEEFFEDDADAIAAYKKATEEISNYVDKNYEYQKGNGWQLKKN